MQRQITIPTSLTKIREIKRFCLILYIDKLLHRNVEKRYPTASSANELANTFADFFHKKIELIRNDLSADCTAVINPHPDEGICSIELDEFKHISEAQIKNLIDTSRLACLNIEKLY